MNVSGILLSSSTWLLPPVTALAAVGLGAATLLLRDHLRLERHALSLEEDIERLRTEIRSLSGAGGPRRSDLLISSTEQAGPAVTNPSELL
jgi:hypothetical protein